MEKFAAGLMLGAVAGALVVTNSYKMRSLVKKSQDELKMKFDDMIDEKIQMMETATTQKPVEEKTDKKKKA